MSQVKLKVSDSIFAKHFLLNEIDIPDDYLESTLEHSIEISDEGEPDTVIDRGNVILLQNPSSLTRFLFNMLYSTLSKRVNNAYQKDKLGLGLLMRCKEYVYADYRPKNTGGPPVLINFCKLPIPSFIIKEIIEPVIGKIHVPSVFFVDCKFTDACRIIERQESLEKQYKFPYQTVGFHDYPILLCNRSLFNSASRNAHLTVNAIRCTLGQEKAEKVLRALFLENDDLFDHLLLVVKSLSIEPDFVLDFLDYFQSCANFNAEEKESAHLMRSRKIAADKHLNIKLARETQVTKQWSQWSMLMGLIEKQLAPMRGSMWPTSTTMKPFEDELKTHQREIAHRKGKNQLNFEELLETARDLYNHNAVEPGKVIEHFLKDVRVWK